MGYHPSCCPRTKREKVRWPVWVPRRWEWKTWRRPSRLSCSKDHGVGRNKKWVGWKTHTLPVRGCQFDDVDRFVSSLHCLFFVEFHTVDWKNILQHLGCIYVEPCKYWDKLPTSTGYIAGFLNHQQESHTKTSPVIPGRGFPCSEVGSQSFICLVKARGRLWWKMQFGWMDCWKGTTVIFGNFHHLNQASIFKEYILGGGNSKILGIFTPIFGEDSHFD